MLTRFYVDNYACLVNFEFKPRRLELVSGMNGSGKSTVRHLITTISQWIAGNLSVSEAFPYSSLNLKQEEFNQRFELDVKGMGGIFTYRLVVEHQQHSHKCRVAEEELLFNKNRLYWFDGSDAHLYRDDPSNGPGPTFPFDWSRSALATIPERGDNTRLTWFRERMKRFYCVAIEPYGMDGTSQSEEPDLDVYLHNIASWYRHVVQDSPEIISRLHETLSEVLDGFKTIRLKQQSDRVRVMELLFQTKNQPSPEHYELDMLSEGQRCLIGLYLTLYSVAVDGGTLVLDEPDNFVALREIQPLLNDIEDECEHNLQCLIISHHPEILDRLARTAGTMFVRDNMGPTRVKIFEVDEYLSPSDAASRGWEQ